RASRIPRPPVRPGRREAARRECGAADRDAHLGHSAAGFSIPPTFRISRSLQPACRPEASRRARPLASRERASWAPRATLRAHLEQWERMLTVLAVHPEGAGFERAQLMFWEPRTELLCARLPARGTDGSMPLGAALDRARIPQATTMLADVGSLARAPSWSTAELAGPAAAAWHRGECAIAPAEVKGAWPGHPEVGAAPVRR